MSGVVLRTWSFGCTMGTRSRAVNSNARKKMPILVLSCHIWSRKVASCTNFERRRNKVVVISGPTGAGKSKLALELAKRIDGEIISADSVQIYRGLDIGSAKLTVEERKEVPHHLIDIADPSDEYSVGQFFEDARKVTDEILGWQRVPIVVGGTGLYLRWYIYGKPDVPVATQKISGEAYSELMHFERTGQWDAAVQLVVEAGDPKACSLPANDWYRLRRSLEIIKSSGFPPSAFSVPYDSFKEQFDSKVSSHRINALEVDLQELDYDFTCFFLSIPRLDLYRLIDFRCEEMLMGSPGILLEASRLLDAGLLPNTSSATRAIGYRQAMEFLLHHRQINNQFYPRDFFSFLSDFQKASRNFSKRQVTWFRNEYIYKWLDASKPFEKVLSFICESYHDISGNLTVPNDLRMRRDAPNRRESFELKCYRPQNRVFVREEDCFHILEWIRNTQAT